MQFREPPPCKLSYLIFVSDTDTHPGCMVISPDLFACFLFTLATFSDEIAGMDEYVHRIDSRYILHLGI